MHASLCENNCIFKALVKLYDVGNTTEYVTTEVGNFVILLLVQLPDGYNEAQPI